MNLYSDWTQGWYLAVYHKIIDIYYVFQAYCLLGSRVQCQSAPKKRLMDTTEYFVIAGYIVDRQLFCIPINTSNAPRILLKITKINKSKEILWPVRGSYPTIWGPPLPNATRHSGGWPHTFVKWHPPLMRHYTNIYPLLILTLLPNLTFYLIVWRFHRTFATGAACQQRTMITPPDHWSCPTLGLACVLMSRPISIELVLFPDFWV